MGKMGNDFWQTFDEDCINGYKALAELPLVKIWLDKCSSEVERYSTLQLLASYLRDAMQYGYQKKIRKLLEDANNE